MLYQIQMNKKYGKTLFHYKLFI